MGEDVDILGGEEEEVEEASGATHPEKEVVDEEADEDEESEAEETEGEEEPNDEDTKEPEEEEEVETEETDEDEKVLSSWTDIKNKYPNIAKDFPDLKTALFREQKFSEYFSNPAEAKEAIDKVETFERLGDDIVGKGNITDLLDHVKEKNKESYEKIVYSLLPHLQEIDKDTYLEIVARPIKQLLRSAYAAGENGKTDLGRAAAHIHKYFFNNLDFDKAVKAESTTEPTSGKTKREIELEQRLSSIEKGKEVDFLTSINNVYSSKMEKYIDVSLEKDERLTDWSRARAREEIVKGVQLQLRKDSRYQSALASLMKQSRSAGYSNDFKTRLINTALVRAKSFVPDVRKKVLADAFGKKKEDKKPNGTTMKSSERKVSSSYSSTKSPRQNNKPLSDLDILRG